MPVRWRDMGLHLEYWKGIKIDHFHISLWIQHWGCTVFWRGGLLCLLFPGAGLGKDLSDLDLPCWTTLSDTWSDFWVVLCGARTLKVPSSLGYSIILWFCALVHCFQLGHAQGALLILSFKELSRKKLGYIDCSFQLFGWDRYGKIFGSCTQNSGSYLKMLFFFFSSSKKSLSPCFWWICLPGIFPRVLLSILL